MISEVILHMGMEKTGSSSIQQSFRGYDDGTLIYAPLEWVNHSLPIQVIFKPYGHQSPGLTAQGLSREEMLKMRARALAQMQDALAMDRERMVFSAEGILSLDGEQHENLNRFITKRSVKSRLFAYVRDPISYAPSSFQQGLKNGSAKFRVPRQHFRKRVGPAFDVYGKDRIELVYFDPKSFPNNSAVHDFAARVGADPSRVTEIRSNESMSMFAAAALFLWNRDGMTSTGAPDLFQARIQLVRHLLDNSQALADPEGDWAPGGAGHAEMNRRGVGKFRFARKLVEDRVIPKDVQWMERKLGTTLLAPRADGMAADDPGIRSEQDFVDVAEAAYPWIVPVLRRYDLTAPEPNTVSALDTLFGFLLARANPGNAAARAKG
ncbi:MAG: hypothetical protein ACWA5A_01580 [Marinibacterium sp.]